ncbi:MFS transporter [Sediminibacterium ginsengisoli]|uniref:Predicted arabinose efflux permease, MFS family n=1 Tax=Sediminibacterium ginsengisoli TaxID=413434 RepID=A0A1T4K7G4_9BACT|nr:MFS transporter [Sediminibacterium ginsengisoli]SJZ38351.1 Predicted arabinose efflux permease, MFS family [Sediminibacterium ginsengisoli]
MASTAPAANHPYFNWQFGLLCISNFLFASSYSMMIPELPGYLTRLGGAEYKGLIIALFTLMAGISRPFSGKLTDTVGRVPVMVFGSLVCVICSLLYPVLTSVAGFLLLRFFHGFSTGFKPTATSAYGADVVHESRRGEALGALSIGYTVGMSLGPLAGSTLVQLFSYNVMFYASSAAALGSVVILYNIRETLPNPQRFSPRILQISRNEVFEKTAVKPAIIMLLLAFSTGCTLTLVPDLTEAVGGHNKGLFFGFYTAVSLLMRIAAGKSSDRKGRIAVLIYSSLGMALAMALLAFANSLPVLLLSAAIFGCSWGMNGPTIAAWTVDLCLPENRGRAVASMYIALEAGIGSGAYFSALIYGNRHDHFMYAFLLPATLALIAFCLLLKWNKKTPGSLIS